MRISLALFAALLLVPLLAGAPAAAKGKEEKPEPHADDIVKAATERFEQDYGSEDMDKRLRILKWYGMHMHKNVLKRLKKIYLKEQNVELQGMAALGLGNQLPYAKSASVTLMTGMKKYDKYAMREMPEGDDEILQENEARVLVHSLNSLAKLGVKPDKKNWKLIRGLIDHHHDDVCIAMLNWCGTTKEWRSIPIILEWFEYYPDGYSWSGGSVSVDTGAAGNKDQKAAKAKWKAKYGSRAKKARPKAHEAMRKALFDITGHKFTKPKELKAWMDENKVLLKKKGV